MLARGVARWVLHQRRVKTEGTVVGTLQEAAQWAVSRLKARGIRYNEAHLVSLLLNEPVDEAIVHSRREIDEDARANIEMVLSAFSEPAFLLDVDGNCLFMNATAASAFREAPAWLKAAVDTGH